jgi:hypothetical protein
MTALNGLENTALPDNYHPVNFIANALQEYGLKEARLIRDERTEGCYGVSLYADDSKIFVWLIDNRLPHEAAKEDPAAERLLARSIPVYCAQERDAIRIGAKWMPIAVTPSFVTPERYHEGKGGFVFVGYVRDPLRAGFFDKLKGTVRVHIRGGIFGQDAVDAYRQGIAGLNVPTLYGLPFAYDVNMRVFEIAGAGVPLVTNYLSELHKLGFVPGVNCLVYRSVDDLAEIDHYLRSDMQRTRALAQAGHRLVTARHLYQHRAARVVDELLIGKEGVW